MSLVVNVKRLPNSQGLPLPKYETPGAACFDLRACVDETTYVQPNTVALVNTGLIYEIPQGYEMQIRPRSGLAKSMITLINSPATIDSDFRGEVKILLFNNGTEPFEVQHGMRIAQALFTPVIQCTFREVTEVSETQRGDKGFGSTGLN